MIKFMEHTTRFYIESERQKSSSPAVHKTDRTPNKNELAPPSVRSHYSPPPRVATPLPPEDFTYSDHMPDIPDTMQEEWYKDKARLVEVDPDIQNSIQEIEDLTKDLQLDIEDDDDAFRVLRGDLEMNRPPVQHPAYRNKIFGDKLFNVGVERRYPRTTSRERPPPTSIRQRRASVPRVNASRAASRSKPNFVPPKNFFIAGQDPRRAAKSPQQFLDELRSHRAPILQNNFLKSPRARNSVDYTSPATPDDLDIDKFLRANSKDGSAGSSNGSRLSTRSTPDGVLDNVEIAPSKIRQFGPAYDDADELILKDIEQEYL